jgi:hypothetical protein
MEHRVHHHWCKVARQGPYCSAEHECQRPHSRRKLDDTHLGETGQGVGPHHVVFPLVIFVQAFLLTHVDVLAEQPDRSRGIPPQHGRDDLAVVAVNQCKLRPVMPFPADRKDGQQDAGVGEGFQKAAIGCGSHQHGVEIQIGLHQPLHLLRIQPFLAGLLQFAAQHHHLVNKPLEGFNVHLTKPMLGGFPNGVHFQRLSQIVQLGDVAFRKLHHDAAFAGSLVKKTFGGQLPDRLSQRRPADADFAGDGGLR